MEDRTGHAVACFSPIELDQDAPSVGFIVDVPQQVQGFGHAPELGQGSHQRRWATASLKRAQQLGGAEPSELERACHPEQVIPVLGNQLGIESMSGQACEWAIVSVLVEAPEACLADVSQTWAELKAQQPEEAEHLVRVAGRVGHDLDRAETGLLLQQPVEDEERVTQRAGDDDAVEPGELITGEVVVGDAFPDEVLRVGTGIQCADRHDEADAVRRGHLAPAPASRQGQPCR